MCGTRSTQPARRSRSDGRARLGLLNGDLHRRPGSEELARELYIAHGTALEHWSRGRFVDAQVAEEVVQEVVLAAWRKYDQFDPERGSERAWMFGIARNVAATRHARNRRHLRSIATDSTPDVEVDDVDMTRVVERSLIADGMQSLSPDHREVIVAAFWDRLSTHEIAERLGVPDGTVKSRIHYGLRALRGALEERKVL
jgi:RNA polymerase sigma-70 factor (ECF subfamily)